MDDQSKFVYDLARKRHNRIGFALCAFMLVWIVTVVLLERLYVNFVPNGLISNSLASLLTSDIAQYVVALPVAMLILSRIEPTDAKQFPMKFKQFVGFFAVSLPIIYVGNIIGTSLSSAMSNDQAQNRIIDLVSQSSMLETFIFTVILAPIVEEWFFRKQLIDRLRLHGEAPAIVFSALAFALFHVNLFQFFYAFGLGLVLGYMYMRTSRLRYSIMLHMIINFHGSIMSVWLAKQLTDPEGNLIDASMIPQQDLSSMPPGIMVAGLYSVLILIMLIIGVVLLVRHRKYMVLYNAPAQLSWEDSFTATYMTPGVMTFIFITVALTVFYVFAM